MNSPEDTRKYLIRMYSNKAKDYYEVIECCKVAAKITLAEFEELYISSSGQRECIREKISHWIEVKKLLNQS